MATGPEVTGTMKSQRNEIDEKEIGSIAMDATGNNSIAVAGLKEGGAKRVRLPS